MKTAQGGARRGDLPDETAVQSSTVWRKTLVPAWVATKAKPLSSLPCAGTRKGNCPLAGSIRLHWKPEAPQPQTIEPVPTWRGVGRSVDIPKPQPVAGDSMLMRQNCGSQDGRVSAPLRSPSVAVFLRSISGVGQQLL